MMNNTRMYSSSYDDERPIIHNLQTIQRKINQQRQAADQRAEQQMDFYPLSSSSSFQHGYRPQSSPSDMNNVLRHSPGTRSIHQENEIIFDTNGFSDHVFHPPATRKVTKIESKENYSLSNGRPAAPVRSTSAPKIIHHEKRREPSLPLTDAQRLKQVRRHEPAKIQTGAGLITPESWRTDPVIIKPPAVKKKPVTKVTKKPVESAPPPPPILDQVPVKEEKVKKIRPQRDKSASKAAPVEEKPPVKRERSKEEKELIKQYIEQKRHKHDEAVLGQKKSKDEHEKQRKDKLKELDEQIKRVAPLPLPPNLVTKRPSRAPSNSAKDHPEEKRQRMLALLGPTPVIEVPREMHNTTPFEHPSMDQRSWSSSSSSSESIVEIQAPRPDPPMIRSRHLDAPSQNGKSVKPLISNDVEQRQQKILRWALNLAHDCNVIEDKIKYVRPDGTQAFDIVPATHQRLQHDQGNLRLQTPIHIEKKETPEKKLPSKLIRPSGRLSHLNQNQASEYENQLLPGIGNLRDPALEQLVLHDRAAAKIQAVYRGYTVRKSLRWNEKKPEQGKKRPTNKVPTYDRLKNDPPPAPLNLHFSDDPFTIGSTILRSFHRNGTSAVAPSPPPKIVPKPSTAETYSDDYENVTSTASSIPERSKQPSSVREKSSTPSRHANRQQIQLRTNSTSSTASTSSSISTTPTLTPEPRPISPVHRRRSMSPPLAPVISADNGRPISPRAMPLPTTTNVTHHRTDERRYSPDALERQLNAEFHLLDGVEASMKQLENMERLRSVALAQQEVVSLAQVLRNKPEAVPVVSDQSGRRSAPTRPLSPSSSTSTSSPVPVRPSKQRTSSSTSSSSEPVVPERVRPNLQHQTALKVFEKRLKTVESKLDQLKNRATRIYDDDRKPAKSSHESSISEDIPVSHRSTNSTISTIPRKVHDDTTSEIRTEIIEKNHEPSSSTRSSTSFEKSSEDLITSGASEIERRIRDYHKQLQSTKKEIDKLKQKQAKEALKQKEEEMKKELQKQEKELSALRSKPAAKPTSITVRKSPAKERHVSSSSSSSSRSSTPTKPQESSIAEELPVPSSASQSQNIVLVNKRIEPVRPSPKKDRDFFDDDDDEDEEKSPSPPPVQKKTLDLKAVETPRDERDTQHDALSISIGTDIAASESDNDSRRASTDIDKPVLNLNTKTSSPPASSSSSSEVLPAKPINRRSSSSPSTEQKQTTIVHDYDEDFSEVSHSPSIPKREPSIEQIDVESIQEDFEEKKSARDANESLSSKSSDDEQSKILVLVKKSANNTPRRQDDKTLEEDMVPAVTPVPIVETKMQPTLTPNDDTSFDISEDETDEDDQQEPEPEQDEQMEQEKRIDRLTDQFLRTFIDEAIDQGKQIDELKKQTTVPKKTSLTQAVKEWLPDEDSTDEEENDDDDDGEEEEEEEEEPRQIPVQYEEEINNIIVPTTVPRAELIPSLDLQDEPNEFQLDLSHLDEKNVDEPRVESPRKISIEEPVKPLVPHQPEKVTQLCRQAVDILFDQNIDFADRSAIQCDIPDYFFNSNQSEDETEELRINRRAYCQMVFDLCVELLHEMDSDSVETVRYPEWQKPKLIPKRFFRLAKPKTRQEIENYLSKTVLEILNLNPRPVVRPKYRVSTHRRPGIERFEIILDDEIRRTESQWLQYHDDCLQVQFQVADTIFDQLIDETFTQCLMIAQQRLSLNSHSTRL